jgi:hypothetical protein
MHVQARAAPKASEADLSLFLQRLAADELAGLDDINVEGVSGAGVETGGQVVFAVENGREGDAHDRLSAKGYHCEWTTELYHERIPRNHSGGGGGDSDDPNQPGVLAGIVQRAKASDVAAGRNIDTVLIGAFSRKPGRFFAQVTFEGSAWSENRPEEPPEPDHDEG